MLNQSLYEFLKDLKQKKLNKLIQEQRPARTSPQTAMPRNIVYTMPADLPLTSDERSVLNKGLKFIPRKPTIDEFQAKHDAEAFFRRLLLKAHFHNQQPDDDQEDSPSPEVDAIDSLFPKKSTWTPRPGQYSALDLYIDKGSYEISKINFQKKLHKCNLSKNEYHALKSLKSRQDIVIKPADKGGRIVVWRKDLYSRVPNKRGGVRIIGGGLEMVRYNNNRGGWNNQGGCLEK